AIEADQVSYQLRKASHLSFPIARLVGDVSSFNVTEFAHTIMKGFQVSRCKRRALNHVSDPWNFRRLLRPGRPANHKEQGAQNKSTDFSSHWVSSRGRDRPCERPPAQIRT